MNDDARFVIKRTYAAPIERVYAAWTDPMALRKWFCPASMTVPEAEADVREGGRYRVCMRSADGSTHVTGGVYHEIVPNQRLVFSWQWEGSELETLVTVELAEAGPGETALTLTHEGFADVEERDKHGQGWRACLEHLARFESEPLELAR